MEEKDKMCGICKKQIIIPGEEYCVLKQFGRDNESKGEGNYHVDCFRKRYLVNTEVNQMMNKTMKLLQKAEERLN